MRFGDLEFRFRWVPTLLLAVPIPLFIALGLWQLDRADQKREQAMLMRERSELPAFKLTSQIAEPAVLRFRTLEARGTFERTGQIFIENRHQGNRIGFHVITPLRIEGSNVRVLVNRGWIPALADGKPIPAPLPSGTVTVRGEAHIPSPPAIVLHGGKGAAEAWGKRWPYLTIELFAALADYPLQPAVILQDPGDPNGFLRSWPREMPKEGMHIGYAIQWFAFAVIALVLWLRLSLVGRADAGITQ